MAIIPPTIPPTTTDVMPLETESGSATHVSCVIAIDVLGVSSGVEIFSVLMYVLVVSEDLVVGASDIVTVDDENENDDDEVVAAVVAVARDVTEAQLQSVVVGSSGIACVVTVGAVVDGMESGQESALSSVHINNLLAIPVHFYSNYKRNSYLTPPEM